MTVILKPHLHTMSVWTGWALHTVTQCGIWVMNGIETCFFLGSVCVTTDGSSLLFRFVHFSLPCSSGLVCFLATGAADNYNHKIDMLELFIFMPSCYRATCCFIWSHICGNLVAIFSCYMLQHVEQCFGLIGLCSCLLAFLTGNSCVLQSKNTIWGELELEQTSVVAD